MANRSQNSSQLLEPSWDQMPGEGRAAEPVWREPSSVQSAPAQRPQYPSHYEEQYQKPGAVHENAKPARRAQAQEESEDDAPARNPSQRGTWRTVKLSLAVLGLLVVAGLLWGMAEVARKHVAHNAVQGQGPAKAVESAAPRSAAPGGQAVSGVVR